MRRLIGIIYFLLISTSFIYADGRILCDTVSLSPKVSFCYDILKEDNLRFHPVNGLDLQESVKFFFIPDTDVVLSTALRVQYAFLPHIFEPELALNLNLHNRHSITLTAGRELHDWKRDSCTEMRWLKNTYSALFAHKNFKVLVDKMYFSSSYTYRPSESSYVGLSYDRYDIEPMENNSTFSFVRYGREYRPNVPDNEYVDSVRVLNSRSGVSAFSFSGGFSIGQEDVSPSLNINVRYINHVRVLHPELTLSQTVCHSKFDMLHWKINAGFFVGHNVDNLSFHEWYHFQTSKKFFPVRDQRTGIVGLVAQYPYALSTNDWHVDSSFRLFKDRLLLLNIPFFNYLFLGESIVVSNVYTAQRDKIYTEVGYELLNVLDAFHIGVFSSFDGKQYKETNIRMGVVPKKKKRR